MRVAAILALATASALGGDLKKKAQENSPLRNVALRASYFHSGQVWNLKQAVGVMDSSQLGAKLSDENEDDIVAFLGTLTGELPNIPYPTLPVRTESTPQPSLAK